jgi:hypothetical protein
MVIELIEEEMPAIVKANKIFEVPEKLPMAVIQQPLQMLPPLFPKPTLRHPNQLDKIYQHPYRIFQDPLHHLLSHLYVSNRILEEPTNGPIHMRDLHLSVRLSDAITAFCLTFLADPPEVNQICDIILPHMKFTLRHVTRRHEYANFATSQLSRNNLQYIWSMIHSQPLYQLAYSTLHQRATLPPNFWTPTHFSNLTNDFYVNRPSTQWKRGVLSDSSTRSDSTTLLTIVTLPTVSFGSVNLITPTSTKLPKKSS